jgi:hypothetical protein
VGSLRLERLQRSPWRVARKGRIPRRPRCCWRRGTSICSGIAGAEATARLLDEQPGTIALLGDLAYPDGASADYVCFDKTWGRHKARLRPALGNHDYHTPHAAGYFGY